MQVNEIDKFRNDFFDKLIKEEKEKEATILRQQSNCVHKYDRLGHPSNGYQLRTCSKCGHSAVKSVRVWQGTENGTCVIS